MKAALVVIVIGLAISCDGPSPSGQIPAQQVSPGAEPRPSWCDTVRKRIAKGDFDEAAREIDSALKSLPSDDEQCAVTADLTFALIGELSDAEAGEKANALAAKGLRAMATMIETQSLRQEVLERAFLRGQYDLVMRSQRIRTPDGRPAYDGHAMDVRRARASAEAFQSARSSAIAAGSLDKDMPNLKRLAADCTRLHERGLAGATGELARARIAAEWWRVRLLPRFAADSKTLRNTFPFTRVPPTEEGGRKAKKQAAALRKAVRNALQNPPTGKAMQKDVQRVLAEKLDDAFHRLVVLVLPGCDM